MTAADAVNGDLQARARAWTSAHASEFDGGEIAGVTVSGLPVAPVYTPSDSPSSNPGNYLERLGLPGEEPYTRGRRAGMYRERLWVMGQYSGQSSPQETNRRIKELLARGQKGFSVALDLPTQNGFDSDHPMACGEVGRVGVPLDTLQDMEDLLDGIDLANVTQVRTTANAIGPLAIAFIVVAAENKGGSPHDFKVMLQNDVLKEYIARGTYIFPPRQGLEFAVDAVEYCARNLPHWEPIEFCGYHVRDSGGTAVQELAIALANGTEYIEACLRRGLHVDDFAHSAYMFLSASVEIFEEAAKYRAARRIWHRLMTSRYGARNPATSALNIFAYTLGGALSAQEPMTNVVRVAYEALGAVLGGAQTLATSSYDEALGLPSAAAAQLALKTQQVLAYETGVTRTADPLGGSYYLEYLTDELERRVDRYLEHIADIGGMLDGIESGDIQSELSEQAYQYQRDVETGERTVVGLNRFVSAGEGITVAAARVDSESAERNQIQRLRAVRQSRDAQAVDHRLSAVRAAALAGENTIPSIIDAVRVYATLGEICGVLTDVWGRYRGSTRL